MDSNEMVKEINKVAFLDTNIFLHFKLFTEIDWLSILGVNSLTIVMPPIVMGELDKHKYSQKNENTKRRAEKVTKKIAELYRASLPVRPDVLIKFESIEPSKEFEENRLSRDSQDDQLLASILLYKSEYPDEDVLLITNDLSLEVKAGYHKIETLSLPDELRLASEQDPNEQKIRNLEQQIREYQRRIPDLKLRFSDGAEFVKISMPSIFVAQEVEDMMNELRLKHPKIQQPSPTQNKRKIRASQLIKEQKDSEEQTAHVDISDLISMKVDRSYLDAVPGHEIKRYNDALDEFYDEYEKYFAAYKRKKELEIRTIKLRIELTNDGSTPGEDIDVYMNFPADLNVVDELKHSLPKIPTLPEPARTNRELNDHRSLGFSRYLSRPPQIYVPPLNRILEPPNVTRNTIKHSDKFHEVSFRVRKLKHGHYISSDLYVIFRSLEEAHSFAIEYRITAGNVPQTISDTLHIRVNRSDSSESGHNKTLEDIELQENAESDNC